MGFTTGSGGAGLEDDEEEVGFDAGEEDPLCLSDLDDVDLRVLEAVVVNSSLDNEDLEWDFEDVCFEEADFREGAVE